MPLTKVASSMLASGASGSGGSVGKNYISSYNNNPCNGDFESGSINGWVSCQVSSITNGLPSGLTLNAGTVTRTLAPAAIAGQYSLQTVFPATADQGFITEEFTIDTQDQAKVLTFTFYYQVTAGASNGNFSGTSANTFIVGIYAVNGLNAGWLQPAGVYSMTQSSGAGIATGTFQTYSDTTEYRFAILCENAPLNPITITFDDFSVSPQTAPIGAPVNDWVDRGPMTIGAVTTPPSKGTIAIDKVFMRRVGDSAQFLYEYSQTTAGGVGNGTYLFSLPSGMSIDASKIVATFGLGSIRSANAAIGFGAVSSTSASGFNGNVAVFPFSATQVFLHITSSQNTSGAGDGAVDEAVSNTAYPLSDSVASYKFTFTVPIAGWSSNVQMSNDTDTRVVACRVTGIPTGTITSSSSTTANINFPTVAFDTHASYSSGLYTVPVSGIYRVTSHARSTVVSGGTFQALGVFVNNSFVNNSTVATPTSSLGIQLNTLVSVSAGQTIAVRLWTDGTTPTFVSDAGAQFLNIERLSGPSVIAASETVACRYTNTAGTSITGTAAVIPFATKTFDTHNAWSGSAFTVPVSGKYFITAHICVSVSSATVILQIRKNTVIVNLMRSLGTSSTESHVMTSDAIDLLAGDSVDFASSTSINGNLISVGSYNQISIFRIGN
jgi:hypothetical protein